MGIIERIGELSGSEFAKALNLGHAHFHDRIGEHGHFGRALVESIAEVCRSHPALMGLAAGLAVEQLLAHEKHHHEELEAARAAEQGRPPPRPSAASAVRRAAPPQTAHHLIRMGQIRPFKIAMEVFAALVLLKFSAGMARAFKRRNSREIWFAQASRVRLLSGTLAAYYAASAIRSPRPSAWRNAAIAGFGTDALKPVLKPRKRRRGELAPPLQRAPAPAPAPAPRPPEPAPAPQIAAPEPQPQPAPPPAEGFPQFRRADEDAPPAGAARDDLEMPEPDAMR